MKTLVPNSLRNAPSLIEVALPVQRLSAEAFKEQEGRQSKTLTPLGSYWKGRKPLILNKACILGCLLPATNDIAKDLRVFELLMAMDDESMAKRLGLETPNELPDKPYKDLVADSRRAEQIGSSVHSHIWKEVNAHLGTAAASFPELIEQLGIMRFGRRPRVADTFSGSGQIPFEAARLGCDVYASDLNPIACMLTWGGFNVVGGSPSFRSDLEASQRKLFEKLQTELDRLGVESDGHGWRAKVYLYCVEATCPQSGWRVPLLPTRIISKGYKVVAKLVPVPREKRYDIEVESNVSPDVLADAALGTVRSEGKSQDPFLIHVIDGVEHKTKITALRGDFRRDDGTTGNRLRQWDKEDVAPRPDDIFGERLYAIQWARPRPRGRDEFEFRAATKEDMQREETILAYVRSHLTEWWEQGLIPDSRIEPGDKTDEPIRTRGWTHWHHLFNPRQLLTAALVNAEQSAASKFALTQVLNLNARLSRFDNSEGGAAATKGVFDNQALNTLFNYGCRGSTFLEPALIQKYPSFPLPAGTVREVSNHPAREAKSERDIYVTDPPYGDAVKYEEILEFFIAWFRKNPPPEFASWVWDSRRALAIKGEDEGFRRGMVAAYEQMTKSMPDNGLQVVMFTHQSGSIWADMANIVWASGLHVTAAWYVVTETDSALRDGSHVKGTVLLVLRKRAGEERTTRDDLAWDLKEEVEKQVGLLTGLSQAAIGHRREENLFADADLQMAGYAAALRVLTRYAVIDGKEMSAEAIRPRVRGEKTFVDELIEFAVGVANEALAPRGIEKSHWDKLRPVERFYCKLLELEAQGHKTLDNYQNFAKAFKVRDFKPFLASHKANSARLKGATEFGRAEMSDGSELAATPLRATLYALMELQKGVDGGDVLTHMSHNVDGFFDANVRAILVELAEYLATKLTQIRPEEASAARVLRELLKNQRM